MRRDAAATLPPRNEFVGRAEQVEQLNEALAARSPAVAVDGLGGIGKTALALEVAHAGDGFEGVVWCSTYQRNVDLNALVDAAARALDYPAVTRLPEDQKVAELRRVLAGHRYLLVVDGYEAIADNAIDDFILHLPEANRALITSRRIVPDIRRVTLRGSTSAALELLRHEAQRLGLDGLEAPRPTSPTLTELTGGSPLALKWALGLLGRGYELADVLATVSRPRVRSSRTSSDTWPQLTEDARTLLQVLACFPAPASRTYLRAALNLSADALGVAIAELLQGSLIQLQGTVARRTYVLPPLLRTFALSRLHTQPDLEAAVRERLADAYRGLVSESRADAPRG